ncbi:MAG: hypothetical protein ACKV2O_19360 [Acidimicrobiales bacterium]
MSVESTTGRRLSRADLEAKFREVQTEMSAGAEKAKGKAVVVGGGLLLLLLLVAFLAGRRGGKKKSTIVEIRRL